MLTHQQILHFRTFGYLTLRGLLSPDEAAMLRGEVDGALTDAFGPPAARSTDLGGISGDYLPLASERAPFSLSLIADDQRTFGASAELLGRPTVPSIGIASRFMMDSAWHTRQGPHVAVETSPGDVVAIHEHLRQCARGGTPRLSWTIAYFPWPELGQPDRLEAVRRTVAGDVEFDHEDYDRERWPVWREWAAGVGGSPSRSIAVERLTLLGILGEGRAAG